MATKSARPITTPAASKPAVQPSGIPAADLPGMEAVFIRPNYTPARMPAGKVLKIRGEAIVRTPEGELYQLQVGDELHKGDMLLTSQDGYVQIEAPGTRMARAPFESGILALPEIDRALFEISTLEGAPGAGLDGEPGNLSNGLQVARILEVVSGSEYVFDPATGPGAVLAPMINQPATPLNLSVERLSVDINGVVQAAPGGIYRESEQPPVVFRINLGATAPTDLPVTLTLKPTPLTPATLTGATGDLQRDVVDQTSGAPLNLLVSTRSDADGKPIWEAVTGNVITVPAGLPSILVRTPNVRDDALYEGSESFTLTATLANQPNVSAASAIATITDEEDRPVVNPVDNTDTLTDGIQVVRPVDPTNPDPTDPNNATKWTVVAGNGIAETDQNDLTYFRVNLSNQATTPVTLHLQTADGSASLGQDYSSLEYWTGSAWQAIPVNGSTTSADIVVPAGSNAVLVRMTVIGDDRPEQSENFQITASIDAQATPSSTLLTVSDDDSAPVVRDDQATPLTEATVSSSGVATATGNLVTGAGDPRNTPTSTPGQDTDADSTALAINSISSLSTGDSATLPANGATLLNGTYGTLSISSTGAYTYSLDNTRAATNALKEGETVQDVFSYNVSDGTNPSATSAALTISIQGANDAPVIITNPTVYTPITTFESALPTGSGAKAGETAAATNTITITDADSPIGNVTYRFVADNPIYLYDENRVTDAGNLINPLKHFDNATRQYYDVLFRSNADNTQLTWYADLNKDGHFTSGTDTDVVRLTLTGANTSGNQVSINYQTELLGSLYHSIDQVLTYDPATTWSIDPALGITYITLSNIRVQVSDTTTSTTSEELKITVSDDEPALVNSNINFGADRGYMYRWVTTQNINGQLTSASYWVDYDTVNATYHYGTFRGADVRDVLPVTQAASAAQLSEATPYYLDTAQNTLYIYTSIGLKYSISLTTGTPVALNTPDTGYVRELIEDRIIDSDGNRFWNQPTLTGKDPILLINHTGLQAAELINGTNTSINGQGDTLPGAAGNDVIYGDGMDAVAYQDKGADTIIGGKGNDTMYGGSFGTAPGENFNNTIQNYTWVHTKDVFEWRLADGGTAGAAATDVIKDFDKSAIPATGTANSGDVLDLKDLLQQEHGDAATYNLDKYLQVSFDGTTATTTVHVSTTGAFTGANTAAVEDQVIRLDNVDLFSLLPTGTAATSDNVIRALLDQKHLIVDP